MYTLIKGKVIEGKKLGRTLGFRTANVEIADNIIAE
jgi:FAD synthase